MHVLHLYNVLSYSTSSKDFRQVVEIFILWFIWASLYNLTCFIMITAVKRWYPTVCNDWLFVDQHYYLDPLVSESIQMYNN